MGYHQVARDRVNTLDEGLAQSPYVAARVGFEPPHPMEQG